MPASPSLSLPSSSRAFWRGTQAALLAPLLCGRRLSALVAEPETGTATARAPSNESATRLAIRVAFALLPRLVRLPGARWRSTCLFRAVADCWILRAEGWPAVVRIGVRHEDDAASVPVAAHAWVECVGVRCLTERGEERATYALLRTHT